jgi:thiamine-phosphate pyrophosphorylase
VIRIRITDGANLDGGVDFIQIRNYDLSARELAELVRKAMLSAPVLVNDRSDIAIACGAAGVHLRAGSVPPAEIKKLAPLIVTVSCHSAAEVEAAQGADYVLLAPIFSPLSKPDIRPPLGLEALGKICTKSTIRVIALGGITAANTPDCIAAGAAGVAGITLFGVKGAKAPALL